TSRRQLRVRRWRWGWRASASKSGGAKMAKKELTLVIRARNAVGAGLRGAWGAVSGFGSRVAGIFGGVFKNLMNIYAGFKMLAGAARLAGQFMGKYAEQEKAERALAASLAAAGDNATELVPKIKAVASAIQDETGAGDEATLAMMARLRLLGVTADKLGDAARATIALKSAGLAETAAQKAVAMAMQGSYDMLNRYVPALRTAKDETEKARIVNELFAKGYEQQKAVLNTTSGAWAALKGRIGDAWEEIGKAIERSFGIRDALNKAGDAVKRFGERVSEWIDSEKFVALQTTIQGILAAMKSAEGRADIGKASWDYLKSIFSYGFGMLKAGGDYIGAQIAAGIRSGLPAMLGGSKKAAEKIKEAAAEAWKYEADWQKQVLRRASGDWVYAMQQHAPPPPPPPPPVDQPVAVVADDEAVDDAQEAADARIAAEKEANDKLIEERERLLEEYAQAEKDALAKQWEAQKDAAEKELALAEELAGKKIAAFIQENKEKAKAEKQAARDAEKEAKRAAILEDRVRKGGRLSKRQQEWLDAFRAIQGAQAQLQPLRDQIKVAEDNLAQLQQTNRTLAEIQKGLDQNHAALNALIKLG
ncbi:MAG: hypothetical protein QM346_00680, partial [Chloroflexota bacterium]|nr:hypothetical protein [Chloroflexota bacterium]